MEEKRTLYDYLYRNLKEQILNGYFACGERLPSLNELCEMYHVGIRTAKDVIRALKEDVTAKQRQVLLLYYAEGLNMREIGERLGVDKSTISRTIKRGERRLQRCLRYGAEAYLKSMDQE